MKKSYLKYYDSISPFAPFHFAMDIVLTRSKLRRLSLRNRLRDYPRLAEDPKLLNLHKQLNTYLWDSLKHLDTYDYGEGYFYQGLDAVRVTGLRDTEARILETRMDRTTAGKTVLDIGCNAGFLANALARDAESVTCLDFNPHLVSCAKAVADFLGNDNLVAFETPFETFRSEQKFDVVLSLANHSTFDGNTRLSLEQYFEKCLSHLRPGGTLVFESHTPEHEGDQINKVRALIDEAFEIEDSSVLQSGTFLDRGRTFIRATAR